MHSCTYMISLLFLEKKEWNLNCFHFFREMKSEIIFLFTLFEKWKVNWFLISLFSRSESEIEKPRDRGVKYEKNSREFSRNETLAGYWSVHEFPGSNCSGLNCPGPKMPRILGNRWTDGQWSDLLLKHCCFFCVHFLFEDSPRLQKLIPKVHPILDLLIGLHNKQGCHWTGDIQETAK